MNSLKRYLSDLTIFNWIITILFALCLTVSTHFQVNGLYDSVDQIVVSRSIFSDIFTFLLGLLIFLSLQWVLSLYSKTRHYKNPKIWLWIPLIVIWIYYLFYALTNYPGSILSDSRSSLNSILLAPDVGLSNHHPILFTAVINVFVLVGKYVFSDISKGVFLYTLFQMTVISIVLAYSIYWLSKRNVSCWLLILLTAIYTFFPHFPMFAIAMWKDPVFGALSLLIILWLVDFIGKKQDNDWRYVARLVAIMFMMMAYRNNGVYVVILFLLYLFIFHFHRLKHLKASIIGIVVFYFLLSGPVYSALNIEKPSVEFLGIPIQQIGYVLNEKPEVFDSEEIAILDEIMPTELWAQQYAPRIVDNIKWNDAWSDTEMNDHFIDFLKVWFNHLVDCFPEYVSAYLMATQGFWDPVKLMMHEYYYTGVVDNDLGIVSRNLLSEKGINVMPPTINIRPQIGSGTLLWLMLASLGVIMLRKRNDCLPSYIFVLCTWATVMIATPLAFGMRYVTPLIYSLPVLMVLPYTDRSKGTIDDTKVSNDKYHWIKVIGSTMITPVVFVGLLFYLVVSRPVFIVESYTDDTIFYPLSSDTVYSQTLSFDRSVVIDRINLRTQWDGKTMFNITIRLTDQNGNVLFERTYESSQLSDDPLNPWSRFYLDDLKLHAGEYTLTLVGNDESYLNGLTIGHQYSLIVTDPVTINGESSQYHLNMKVIGYPS